MCQHITECPDATQCCAGASFCPLIGDIDYSYVGPVKAHEEDHGRPEYADDDDIGFYEC